MKRIGANEIWVLKTLGCLYYPLELYELGLYDPLGFNMKNHMIDRRNDRTLAL